MRASWGVRAAVAVVTVGAGLAAAGPAGAELAAARPAGAGLAAAGPAGAAAYAQPAEPAPWLLSSAPAVVRPHAPTWVTMRWLGASAVCDFRLTATAPGVTVVYPSNTGSYTSFYRGDSLAPGEIDYTAFRVEAADQPGAVALRLRLTFTAPGNPEPGCAGPVVRRTTTVALGIVPAPA